MIKFKRFFDGPIPNPKLYPENECEYQYISGSLYADRIYVIYNKKVLFNYCWIDGVDAIKYSRLEEWHARYNRSNPQ